MHAKLLGEHSAIYYSRIYFIWFVIDIIVQQYYIPYL